MDADIVSGIETIMKVSHLYSAIKDADWVITGEGKFDSQSLNGKVVSGILGLAKSTNARVGILAGSVSLDEKIYQKVGVIDAVGVKKKEMTIRYAMANGKELLTAAATEFAQKHFIK